MHKRIYVFVFVIIASQLLIGCQKEKSTKLSLTGTWIELNNQKDTIDFNNMQNQMTLRRGYELINGQQLQKNGSGIYSYKLKPDSIAVNNVVWNCICFQSYYFKVNCTYDTLQIGNFYETETDSKTRITFYKKKPGADFIPF